MDWLMDIIDAHQHFWNYNAQNHQWINDDMKALRADFLPSHLKERMDLCYIHRYT